MNLNMEKVIKIFFKKKLFIYLLKNHFKHYIN